MQDLIAAIAEGAADRDRQREHPWTAVRLIRRSRLGALRIPAEQGGGTSLRELFEVVLALAAADANVAHIMRNHFSFVERHARQVADAQRAAWRQAATSGAIFGLAMTELNKATIGKDDITTTVLPAGDGYVLNGTKYYSTGTLYADYIVVRAKSPDDQLASVVVPADRAGITRLDDWDGMGQRLTGTGTTVFDQVAVATAEVLFDGAANNPKRAYASTMAQLYLTAVNAGIVRAVLADARSLLKRRVRTFFFAGAERPTEDPLLLQTVGEIASYAFAAEATVLAAVDALARVFDARDHGTPDADLAHEAARRAAEAKVFVDKVATQAADMLFDVGGASATQQRHGLDRHWRNARTLACHNPRAYKALAVGALVVDDTPLPSEGFF